MVEVLDVTQYWYRVIEPPVGICGTVFIDEKPHRFQLGEYWGYCSIAIYFCQE